MALTTAALLLKNANKFSPALAAYSQMRTNAERRAVAVKLADALLKDEEATQDLLTIISNLLDREVTTFAPLEIADEVREAWIVNNMQQWLQLGRTVGVFSQRDLAGWAWVLANWETNQDAAQRSN